MASLNSCKKYLNNYGDIQNIILITDTYMYTSRGFRYVIVKFGLHRVPTSYLNPRTLLLSF